MKLSEITYKQIANEFIGDQEQDIYKYKTGGNLVRIFNDYFEYNDTYSQGFPSRWLYTQEKIKEIGLLKFLKVILSSKYLRVEEDFDRSNVADTIENAIKRFNRFLDREDYKIKVNNQNISIQEIKDGTVLGVGGFATVYLSGNKALKVLHPELRNNESAVHRFKREYEITDSIKGIDGIMQVSNFDKTNLSYQMEYCEMTLEKYFKNKQSSDEKHRVIEEILKIMSQVHEKNIMHRDLTPNNIFMNKGKVIIGDFGLGKDLNAEYSHHTRNTQNLGQYFYAAPEQMESLRNSTVKSDVYSMGKVINFILAGHPKKTNHECQYLVEKATVVDPSYRHLNCYEFLQEYQIFMNKKNDEQIQRNISTNIFKGRFSDETNNFILSLDAEEFSDFLAENNNSVDAVIYLFTNVPNIAKNKLIDLQDNIGKKYSWEQYDNFSKIAYHILQGKEYFSYETKVIAAHLLDYTAHNINRFHGQDLVEDLLKSGIDPTLEEIITRG